MRAGRLAAALGLGLAVLGLGALGLGAWVTRDLWRDAPGESFAGPPPELTVPQLSLAERLRRDVTALAGGIGRRDLYRPDQLHRAADWIAGRLAAAGLEPERLPVIRQGLTCDVVAARVAGRARPDALVVVGAHYDTAVNSPGANANASGVAVLLALAEALAPARPDVGLVFAAFPFSVRPSLQTEDMGALAFARHLDGQGAEVLAMLSLDSLGYFSDAPGSQDLPAPVKPFFPDVGDYVAIVGDLTSADLTRRVTGLFREHATVPSQTGVGPAPWDGIGWSDHWAFWQLGWPACVITDTAHYRDPESGRLGDTPERLDYETMARIAVALTAVVAELAEVPG